MERKTLLLISFTVEGGVFLVGLVLINHAQVELWARFNISWKATALALLLCIPMFIALYAVVRSRWELLSRLRAEIDEKITPIFARCKIIDLAVIALLAGAGEELFFRGWLQGILTNRFEAWLRILITSVIFGIAHYLSTAYVIYAFLTGIYLGVIYQAFGNLYIVMTIHAVYDFAALVYLFKKSKAQETGEEISVTNQQVE